MLSYRLRQGVEDDEAFGFSLLNTYRMIVLTIQIVADEPYSETHSAQVRKRANDRKTLLFFNPGSSPISRYSQDGS